MNTILAATIAILVYVVVTAFAVRRLRLRNKKLDKLCGQTAERAAYAEMAHACAADNLNFMGHCLVQFAGKMHGIPVPTYDGKPYSDQDSTNCLWPGDIVSFADPATGAVLQGEVHVNLDDEGDMPARCPVCLVVTPEKGDDIKYEYADVTGVTLIQRPEHFVEMAQNLKQDNQ